MVVGVVCGIIRVCGYVVAGVCDCVSAGRGCLIGCVGGCVWMGVPVYLGIVLTILVSM